MAGVGGGQRGAWALHLRLGAPLGPCTQGKGVGVSVELQMARSAENPKAGRALTSSWCPSTADSRACWLPGRGGWPRGVWRQVLQGAVDRPRPEQTALSPALSLAVWLLSTSGLHPAPWGLPLMLALWDSSPALPCFANLPATSSSCNPAQVVGARPGLLGNQLRHPVDPSLPNQPLPREEEEAGESLHGFTASTKAWPRPPVSPKAPRRTVKKKRPT